MSRAVVQQPVARLPPRNPLFIHSSSLCAHRFPPAASTRPLDSLIPGTLPLPICNRKSTISNVVGRWTRTAWLQSRIHAGYRPRILGVDPCPTPYPSSVVQSSLGSARRNYLWSRKLWAQETTRGSLTHMPHRHIILLELVRDLPGPATVSTRGSQLPFSVHHCGRSLKSLRPIWS